MSNVLIESKDRISEHQLIIQKLRNEIEKVMIGQKDVIDQLIWAVLGKGHALLEGVPGLGKTLLVRTLAQAIDLSFHRIQFTPDLMPADIIGTNILQMNEEGQRALQFQKGPIFAHVVLADEINRATPKTQSALLESMQESTVSLGGVTYPLPSPFFVLATQNPLENEGTYPLPEAQMDRFLLKIEVPFPNENELKEIIIRHSSTANTSVQKVANGEQITAIQETIQEILVAEPVIDYAVKLLLATHSSKSEVASIRQFVRVGSGPRGLQAMIALAKVRAFIDGRYNISFADINAVMLPALRHRILLNFEAEANGINPDHLLNEIIEAFKNEK